ncbi:MAG: HAD family phosphatase [Candidatus Nanopelagicaceae bacterium]|nr:HAD family phosphatase [Candidatus Nanopelagicaceae bacterium]
MPTEIRKMNFPFAAVLWDMDGTLIDSEPIWIQQEYELMASLGVTWSDEDAIHCVGGPMTRVDAYMRSKLDLSTQQLFPPMALTEQLLLRMAEQMNQGVDFAPGAENLLNEFKALGVKQGLVSASSRQLVDAAINSIGRGYFEVTIADNDVANSKPNPEGYLKAATKLGVNIENCLILEDSITGITAAIHSGAYVIGIPHVAELPMAPKVVHIDSLVGANVASIVERFSSLIGDLR